jgi:putative transposase
MKRSKFTEAQIAFILRQGEEGTAVGEICRKAGISEATYLSGVRICMHMDRPLHGTLGDDALCLCDPAQPETTVAQLSKMMQQFFSAPSLHHC